MWNRRNLVILFLLTAIVAAPSEALPGDEEGCMICHRLGIRKATAEGGTELRVSDPAGSSHEALYCSDCHPDAKSAPHATAPGTASCIGECHSSSAKARETHRSASFGGLNEAHRAVSAPRAPCLLCHRSTDRPPVRNVVSVRCAGCHAKEKDSVSRGVHARFRSQAGEGMCGECHLAHGTAAPNDNAAMGKVNCGGAQCHARVSDRMRRLGGHEKERDAGGKAGAAGIFLAVVAIGFVSGRYLGKSGRPGRVRK